MAIAYSAEAASICQEAMFLLRQDTTVPASATAWNANSPVEWWKCKVSLETALNEVINAFTWTTAISTSNLSSWPTKCRNAAVYCLARECAIPIAGRIEDMKVMDAMYKDKLLQAKMSDLNASLAANTDPVLAQLLANFKADDPALVNTYTVYTNRSSLVKAESDKEVKKTLGLTTLDDLAQQASYCLTVAKLAAACGLDANFVQLKMAEYDKLIVEYRKNKLETEVTGHTGVYTAALNEVKKVLGITSTPDDLAVACAELLARAHNGERCGYDANYVQTKLTEYQAKIHEWRKIKLDEALKSNNDTILAQLLAPFKEDDTKLCNAFDIYTKKVSAIASDCEKEVRSQFTAWATDTIATTNVSNETITFNSATYNSSNETLTLEWQTARRWYPAYEALMKSKLALAMGHEANVVQLYEQEYAAKLSLGIKNELNISLAANTDPVLTEIMMNFKSDDTGLVNAYAIYTQRSSNIKEIAETEINLAHEWSSAFDWSATTANAHPAYAAWLALCVSKLTVAMGLDANHEQLAEQKYAARLQIAIAADLENEKNAITDIDTKDVLSTILGSFAAGDAKMPRSLSSITDRIDTQKNVARKEVLLAHPWNFAVKTETVNGSQPNPANGMRFTYQYPHFALRLISVYGVRGKLNEWTIENGEIMANEPITKIKYIRDVTNLDQWSPIARNLYVMKLKALVARTVMSSAQDAAIQEQQYLAALENAKLNDAKETNRPEDAWGDNFYVERMRGNDFDRRRENPFRR